MRNLTLCCLVGLFTASLFVLSKATVGGQYSVNVHFVPPLVTATCSVAQFWSPPNVTCALCFCMTGSLSRCIPQPGCNPQAQNSSTTTARPGSSTTPGMGSNPNQQVPHDPQLHPGSSTPAPGQMSSSTMHSSMEQQMQQGMDHQSPPAMPPAGGEQTPPAAAPGGEAQQSTGGKIRGAKPGKLRRRRRSYN